MRYLSNGKYRTLMLQNGARCDAVVEALRYKPEGRGINSRLCD
jgi:hypothetical protein